MFELGIFCVILLAVGYWTAMWMMGRHDDVLHGNFVTAEQPAATPVAASKPYNAELLQSLLISLQGDLKDAGK